MDKTWEKVVVCLTAVALVVLGFISLTKFDSQDYNIHQLNSRLTAVENQMTEVSFLLHPDTSYTFVRFPIQGLNNKKIDSAHFVINIKKTNGKINWRNLVGKKILKNTGYDCTTEEWEVKRVSSMGCVLFKFAESGCLYYEKEYWKKVVERWYCPNQLEEVEKEIIEILDN